MPAVDEEQRQRRAPLRGDGRAPADDRDDLVLEAGAGDGAPERPAGCPSARARGRPGVGSWCSQPAWFSSEPRWWSTVNDGAADLAGRGAQVDRGLAAVGADLERPARAAAAPGRSGAAAAPRPSGMKPLAARAWSSRSAGMSVTRASSSKIGTRSSFGGSCARPRLPRRLSMSIGISDEHVELARQPAQVGGRRWAVPSWSATADGDAGARFDEAWKAVGEMGVATIGLPEAAGGGGGRCSTRRSRSRRAPTSWCPARCSGPVVARGAARTTLPDGAVVGLALGPSRDVVWDAPSATHLLVSDADGRLVPGAGRRGDRDAGARRSTCPAASARREVDLADGASGARPDRASWCAVRRSPWPPPRPSGRRPLVPADRGRVRQGARAVRQADRQLPGGQAPVRRDAGDRRGGHRRRVGRRRRAAVRATTSSGRSPPTSPPATAFDGAVEVAQDCIQVLGGIGFTYEHDAHLYLRRALALRALLGDGDAAAERLLGRGRRRRTPPGRGRPRGPRRADPRRDPGRPPTGIAACRTTGARRWSTTGYLTPHWPAPYGLGADPVTQIVIDQELAARRA